MNTEHYKTKLNEEKERLLAALQQLGRRDTRDTENWEGQQPDLNILESDRNESADEQEEYREVSIITEELETSLRAVNDALERIEGGTYGICTVGQGTDDEHMIEEDRLEAAPSARTCKAHINTEV